MLNSKVNVIVIIASFFVFQHDQTAATEPLIDEYLGTWYDVAIISSVKFDNYPVQCQWAEVRPANGDNYEEVLTVISMMGPPRTSTGTVTILGSEISIQYGVSEETKITYEARIYNKGWEMILRDITDLKSSVLISRNTTASQQAVADFEALAEEVHGFTYHIDNSKCS